MCPRRLLTIERAAGGYAMKITKILVPVDLSDGSVSGVAYAAELRRLVGATVEVLHVLRPFLASSPRRDPFGFSPGERWEDELDQLVSGCREQGYALSHRVQTGDPAEEIIAAAQAGAFDLVVMGASARTHLSRVLRPSTTDAVRRRSRCPVVVVPLAGRGIS